ncbi:putative short chain dehydrogenase [Cystobacter fuscus DSM 2262]|uniref:Short chain dehydrogenase n=1 Tax=Cystobacter fuscus (strain ATCC 25194 / DSM 2262 / NBRC 100088 / M29) TaxID=1242864 RepID=S9QUH9_CYSF2|nr:SDR family NAD(P)-dependent oxidoreductase [Cystobacter fuscus]EPX64979.1 putative short chain dehydrogenase [Cystobacter fuscus DSM 2262]
MAESSYRTALITGASSGLGRGLALWFARRGVKVYAAARRKENLEALAQEARAAHAHIEPVELDVAQADATLARVRELDDACGGLDLIVANAGFGQETSGKRIKWETVKRTIDVNVSGAAATLSAVLPRMVERKRGHVVGVASMAAFRGLPRNAAYSASKAFLHIFLESLRVDLQGTGVKVSCLYPGFVKSEMTAQNKFSMPFLLETDAAVELMGQAILRGEAEYAFPWQMKGVMGLVKHLPNGLFDGIARRAR